MKLLSAKSLLLFAVLLGVAAVCYNAGGAVPVRAATYGADDKHEPNQPRDPNRPPDPNAPATNLPEMSLSGGSLLWLSTTPTDANEPNRPPRPAPPERA
jgi:hypothetical protein